MTINKASSHPKTIQSTHVTCHHLSTMDSIKLLPLGYEKKEDFFLSRSSSHFSSSPFPKPDSNNGDRMRDHKCTPCPAFDPENSVNLECKGSGRHPIVVQRESSAAQPNQDFSLSPAIFTRDPNRIYILQWATFAKGAQKRTHTSSCVKLMRPNWICCRRPACPWSWRRWENCTRTARCSTGSPAWCSSSCHWCCSSFSTRSWCWRCTGRSASVDNSRRCAFHLLTWHVSTPDRNTRDTVSADVIIFVRERVKMTREILRFTALVLCFVSRTHCRILTRAVVAVQLLVEKFAAFLWLTSNASALYGATGGEQCQRKLVCCTTKLFFSCLPSVNATNYW